MNHPIKFIVGLAITVALTLPLHAAGTSSAQFLKMGAGARAAAMGDAFVSVADDASATYWNPAGLNQVKVPELSLMQANALVQTQYQFLGAVIPVHHDAIGLVIQRMDYGTMDTYSADDVNTGNFNAGSMAAGLCASFDIHPGITLGLTGKYIGETIASKSANTYAADIGVLLKERLFNRFNFGFVVQNMGGKLKFLDQSESLPQIIRTGISTRFFDRHLLASFDYSIPNDNAGSIHAGLEFNVNSLFILRGGYQATPGNSLKVDGIKNITAGMGLNIGVIGIDYAFVPYGDLGQIHRISALLKFNTSNL